MEKCADIEATHIFHTMLIVGILSFIRIRWPLWDSIMEMCHAHWNCVPLYLIPPWSVVFSLKLSLVWRFVVGCCSIRWSQYAFSPSLSLLFFHRTSGTMWCTSPISRDARKFIEVEALDFRWHSYLCRNKVKWNMKIKWNSEWWTKQITNSIISMLSIECNWMDFLQQHPLNIIVYAINKYFLRKTTTRFKLVK